MSNLNNESRSSINIDLTINEEGKDLLMENYSLREKLESLQKEYDFDKFQNESKIKELENKVSHLTSSLQNANQTIEVLKNVDNQEDSQIKEMIEKMRQKITDLENFNFSLRKENADFLSQLEHINKEKTKKFEEENPTSKNSNNNNQSFDSDMSFSNKTPEEIKIFFKNLKNEKDNFYDNAVNIITENEIEIETYKNNMEDYRNLIKIYDVKYNLLRKNLKNKMKIDLPNLEDFEEDKHADLFNECETFNSKEYNYKLHLKTYENEDMKNTSKNKISKFILLLFNR